MKINRILYFFAFAFSLVLGGLYLLDTHTAQAQGKPEFVSGEVLVKFNDGTNTHDISDANKAAKATVKREISQLGVQVVDVNNIDQAINAYKHNANVQYAEPDYYAQALTSDTYFSNQWAFNNTGQQTCNTAGDTCTTGLADADIDAPEAWAITTGSPNVKIAMLDTGVDHSHPDLVGKIVADKNFTDSSTDDDLYGHGTHTSGIAAANTNNNLGVAGIGYNSSIMNVKVLNDSGSGAYSWIANGIIWATDNGAKVISMSLGGSFNSKTLQNAVNYAWNHGVVLVAAAGNSANPSRTYPAYYSNVIAVAATDNTDHIASFSSYGSWVDVAAPGVDIYSTFPTHSFVLQTEYGRSENYDFGSGTSMSTPMVAGIAALVWNTPYGTSNQAVRYRIEHTADKVPGTGTYWTWGRVNACNAVGGNCSYDLATSTPIASPKSHGH